MQPQSPSRRPPLPGALPLIRSTLVTTVAAARRGDDTPLALYSISIIDAADELHNTAQSGTKEGLLLVTKDWPDHPSLCERTFFPASRIRPDNPDHVLYRHSFERISRSFPVGETDCRRICWQSRATSTTRFSTNHCTTKSLHEELERSQGRRLQQD